MTKTPKRKAAKRKTTERTVVHTPLAAHSNAFAPHRPVAHTSTPTPVVENSIVGVKIFVATLVAAGTALLVFHFVGGL